MDNLLLLARQPCVYADGIWKPRLHLEDWNPPHCVPVPSGQASLFPRPRSVPLRVGAGDVRGSAGRRRRLCGRPSHVAIPRMPSSLLSARKADLPLEAVLRRCTGGAELETVPVGVNKIDLAK